MRAPEGACAGASHNRSGSHGRNFPLSGNFFPFVHHTRSLPQHDPRWRVKPWNDCDREKLMGRGREACAQFSSISAGPTSRPAAEMEPVARRIFAGTSLQQFNKTENKSSTSKHLVVSYRALPSPPVRRCACSSDPTAACGTCRAVRKTDRPSLNAGRQPATSCGSAAAWITPNWPVPAGWVGSRRIAFTIRPLKNCRRLRF
jgi:hypothetical protein